MIGLHWLVAIVISSFLVSCGGSINSEKPPLFIKVRDCEKYEVAGFSSNIYVTVGRECISPSYEIEISRGDDVRVVRLSLQSTESLIIKNLYYKLSLFKENTWRKIENPDSWSHRDGAGAVVINEKIYLLGGWNHETVVNEVWISDDLFEWKQLPNAPWQARHGAGWLVHKGKIFVVGGDLIDDVWSSPDGINWKLETSQAPFGQRYTPIASSTGEYIYLYGGQYWTPVWWCSNRPDCLPVGPQDVWRSKDGVFWEKVLDNAPWRGRALIHGSIFFQNKFFLLGGGLKNATGRWSETFSELKDIWSSYDGVLWKKEAEEFNFSARTHFSVLSTPDGCYVSDGSVGVQANVSNELFFAFDCVNYEKLDVPIDLPARHASSLFEFNKSIVLLGGPPTAGAGTTIWQYFPRLKDKR
jgi:hypothetical protein